MAYRCHHLPLSPYNNNYLLEKDGGAKNCVYKDLWYGIQGLVSACWLLLDPLTTIRWWTIFMVILTETGTAGLIILFTEYNNFSCYKTDNWQIFFEILISFQVTAFTRSYLQINLDNYGAPTFATELILWFYLVVTLKNWAVVSKGGFKGVHNPSP